MSVCSVLRDIQNISQTVADFLGNPNAFTPAVAANLVTQFELVRGAVRELPINFTLKNDILTRLNEAQFILQQNGILGFNTITELLAVLQIITVSALKVQNLRLPCPQGITTVVSSNAFSTICDFCR
jgi:hypothetical protein